MLGVLVALATIVGAEPAAASAGTAGLALAPLTATTGLTPGATVKVRISGAAARQVVRYGVCADPVRCAPSASVWTDATGTATVTVTATGMATLLDGGRPVEKACRPDRCHVVAHPDGKPGAIVSRPLRFVGERVTPAFAPTSGLSDGQLVRATGRVRGAEGRIVRFVQALGTPPNTTASATLAEARVAADGTFALEGRVRRLLAGADCSPRGTAAGPCHLAVSVVGDPSFGIASAYARLLAPGPTAAVTPRTDLVDRAVVRVTGTRAALAGRTVRLRQLACDVVDPADPICSAGPSVAVRLDAQGRLATSFTVRRTIGTQDCARSRYPVPDCSIEVTVLNAREAPDTQVEVTRATVFFRPL